MRQIIVVLALLPSVALAQQQPVPYTPLDEAQWTRMVQALMDVPMSYQAHQQQINILATTMQQAYQKKQQELQSKSHPPPLSGDVANHGTQSPH
jgi:hypothetical protein